ncbi:MAG TPA: hypothetical protein VJM74_07690 [Nitrososphaeraceae archaeon]|nr:hypothetical protein [Nitrososphaeraceae archaeon]
MFPEKCSIQMNGKPCSLPPSSIVSVLSENGEYMIGLVCDDHIVAMKTKTLSMQKSGKISKGEIKFQRLKPVMTDCVLNLKDID